MGRREPRDLLRVQRSGPPSTPRRAGSSTAGYFTGASQEPTCSATAPAHRHRCGWARTTGTDVRRPPRGAPSTRRAGPGSFVPATSPATGHRHRRLPPHQRLRLGRRKPRRGLHAQQSDSVDPVRGWQFAAGRFSGRGGQGDLFAYHPVTARCGSGRTTPKLRLPRAVGGVDPSGGVAVRRRLLRRRTCGTDAVGTPRATPRSGSARSTCDRSRATAGRCPRPPDRRSPSACPAPATRSRRSAGTRPPRRPSTPSRPGRAVHRDAAAGAGLAVAVRAPAGDTFTLVVPPDWASGVYSAACTDAEGGTCDITFVVKPAPAERSRIAVLANANTWLAYNGWGGQSKYSGSPARASCGRCRGRRPEPTCISRAASCGSSAGWSGRGSGRTSTPISTSTTTAATRRSTRAWSWAPIRSTGRRRCTTTRCPISTAAEACSTWRGTGYSRSANTTTTRWR